METSNKDNGELQNHIFWNKALIDAGLEPSSAAPPPGQFTQFALLIAILVFVGASCSLIVIATVCVQFC
ncbi:unnamed protein product [Cylicostephanus goldi]|uniref:Uncharacterized protein n=1 Tax=Cylicostephanus goldi TaxID=71465 RepID=A0A3P7MZ24_CYLGO|nr:unnamed protein product [Cylicostephanus goldi]